MASRSIAGLLENLKTNYQNDSTGKWFCQAKSFDRKKSLCYSRKCCEQAAAMSIRMQNIITYRKLGMAAARTRVSVTAMRGCGCAYAAWMGGGVFGSCSPETA